MLGLDDFKGRAKHIHTRMEAWCLSSGVLSVFRGKVESRGANVFLLWNMDLTSDVTACTRRRAAFSQSSFSRTPKCFSFLLALILPSKAALKCYYGSLRLLSDYAFVCFWWSWARIRLLIS